jgi:hypothetical protein
MLNRVDWQIVTDVSKGQYASFRGIIVPKKRQYYLQGDTVWHLIRLQYSTSDSHGREYEAYGLVECKCL